MYAGCVPRLTVRTCIFIRMLYNQSFMFVMFNITFNDFSAAISYIAETDRSILDFSPNQYVS